MHTLITWYLTQDGWFNLCGAPFSRLWNGNSVSDVYFISEGFEDEMGQLIQSAQISSGFAQYTILFSYCYLKAFFTIYTVHVSLLASSHIVHLLFVWTRLAFKLRAHFGTWAAHPEKPHYLLPRTLNSSLLNRLMNKWELFFCLFFQCSSERHHYNGRRRLLALRPPLHVASVLSEV